jgi:hypothetical protein
VTASARSVSLPWSTCHPQLYFVPVVQKPARAHLLVDGGVRPGDLREAIVATKKIHQRRSDTTTLLVTKARLPLLACEAFSDATSALCNRTTAMVGIVAVCGSIEHSFDEN